MARQLGAQGCRLALTGRRADKLAQAAARAREAGGEVLELQGSVSDHETVSRHYAQIKQRWGGLDWAILNAGVSESLNAREFSAKNVREIYETNVFGVAEWLEAVLPDMLAAGGGTVAGISSLAAVRGLPNSGSYCSSKAALNTLLESARVDLRGSGVKVVTVCPGFVRSEITARNNPKDMVFLMDTEEGVRRILSGIAAGRRVVSFPARLALPMKLLFGPMPDFLYDPFAARFLKRRKTPARPG